MSRRPDHTGEKRDTRFAPGQSGNPAGRPVGARNKLGEAFLAALYEDWQEHGVETIRRVREEKPDQYLKVIASLLPRDLNVSVNPLEDWSDEELNAGLAALREEIRAAGAVLDDDEEDVH